MIQDALRALPAWPALIVAPLLILGGLIYYYYETWQTCIGHAELRMRLHQAVEDAGAGSGQLRLAEATGFDWARVGIFPNHKPVPGQNSDCPFGWDWTAEEREKLAADGLLTLLVFTKDKELLDTIELHGDRVAFEEMQNPYTRDSAVFEIRRSKTGPAPLIARPLSAQ